MRKPCGIFYRVITVIGFSCILFTQSSCEFPAVQFFSEDYIESSDNPVEPLPQTLSAEKIVFFGPVFSLEWDTAETAAGSYSVYVRTHMSSQWTLLADNLVSPSISIDTSILAYGEYEFAVSFTSDSGLESELHSSIEQTALPSTGWYLAWIAAS